jgi:hypothetical protein
MSIEVSTPTAAARAGVFTANTRPPSYDDLHPLASQGPFVPVFADLSEQLLQATKHPDPENTVPYTFATYAGYAYSDQATVSTMAARLGLEGNHCRMVAEYVDVMFICSTAFLIQSRDGRVVILVYRGTTPTSAINWLTDLDVDPEKVKIDLGDTAGEYMVHRGFYRNVRATGYEVIAALQRALDGKSVLIDNGGESESMPNPMEALYITGHSLGAAMAIMAALLLRSDEAFAEIFARLRAVYTFGGPMVGDRALAGRADDEDVLGGKVVRYVYGHDVVPRLPPKASGDFAHIGPELRHKGDEHPGGWYPHTPTTQMGNPLELAELLPSFLARQLAFSRRLQFGASIEDHLPQHYIATLRPPGVRSEFGD